MPIYSPRPKLAAVLLVALGQAPLQYLLVPPLSESCWWSAQRATLVGQPVPHGLPCLRDGLLELTSWRDVRDGPCRPVWNAGRPVHWPLPSRFVLGVFPAVDRRNGIMDSAPPKQKEQEKKGKLGVVSRRARHGQQVNRIFQAQFYYSLAGSDMPYRAVANRKASPLASLPNVLHLRARLETGIEL